MIAVLDFIFSSFWIWAGSMALLYILTVFITNILNMFMYHRTIRKIGYPPPHCAEQTGLSTIKKKTMRTNAKSFSNWGQLYRYIRIRKM